MSVLHYNANYCGFDDILGRQLAMTFAGLDIRHYDPAMLHYHCRISLIILNKYCSHCIDEEKELNFPGTVYNNLRTYCLFILSIKI